MDEDRPKKSWKEIDQARDRGIRFEKKAPQSVQREQKAASSQAKKKLEALFSSSKATSEKAASLAKIKSSRGKPEFYEHLTLLFTTYGVPRDVETFMLLLDHKDSTILEPLLAGLRDFAPKQTLSDQDLIAAKLNVLEVSTFDSNVLLKIKEVKKALLRL